MKIWITFLCSFLLLPFSAQAEPPSEASIVKLMQIMQIEDFYKPLIQHSESMIKASMEEMLKDKAANPEAQAALERYRSRMQQHMRDTLGANAIKDITVDIYRNVYTQEEVDALIGFYESPAGQSTLKKMPITTEKTLEMVRERIMLLSEKIRLELEENFSDTLH